MWVGEFADLHDARCREDPDGWLMSCTTLDGRTRRPRTVRATDEAHRQLGSASLDTDGRMGEDARRWPPGAFAKDNVQHMSIRARFACVDPYRGATDLRVADGHVHLYRALSGEERVLKWRVEPDLWHVGAVLANGSGLKARPGIVRLALRSRAASFSKEWTTLDRPAKVVPTRDVELGVHAVAPLRQIHVGKVMHTAMGGDVLVPLTMPIRIERSVAHASTPAGATTWRVPASHVCPDDEEVRQRVLELAGCGCTRSMRAVPSIPGLAPKSTRIIPDEGILYRIPVDDGDELTVRVGPFVKPGGGFVYTTDYGLQTGHPHCHTSTTTVCLDSASPRLGRHTNLAAHACVVSGNGRASARATLVAILRFLLQRTATPPMPALLVAEAHSPVWRAQLVATLKFGTVNDQDTTARLLTEGASIALTPDQRSVRIRGRSGVVPLVFVDDAEHVLPRAFEGPDANVTDAAVEALQATLEPATRHSATWTSSTVLSIGGRRVRNMWSPIPLEVDEWTKTDANRANALAFAIETPSHGVAVFDNFPCTDTRSLLLAAPPTYGTTGEADGLLLRPFPSQHALRTMLQFCVSDASNSLFAPSDCGGGTW